MLLQISYPHRHRYSKHGATLAMTLEFLQGDQTPAAFPACDKSPPLAGSAVTTAFSKLDHEYVNLTR